MRQYLHLPKPITLLFCLLFTTIVFKAQATTGEKVFVTIMDEQSRPLVGVTVFTPDHSYSSSSDLLGRVDVSQFKMDQVLVFSYMGYETAKVSVADLLTQGKTLKLKPNFQTLVEVMVVGRKDDALSDLPYQVDQIKKEQIELVNSQTSADALQANGDVFVQKSQMGGGSPIIRGFEANRVLLVVDGVRMNNAIYRNGHLQNAITVSPNLLEQIEVIHGPGSLMYGSDALGGVVHFRTKDPKLYLGKEQGKRGFQLKTDAFIRYASANDERTAHVDFNIGKRKWAFLTSFSYSGFDDLVAGSRRPLAHADFGQRPYFVKLIDGEDFVLENDDLDRQVGTAYSQFDFMQKVKYQANDKLYFLANFQYSNSSDVPRYDRLTETNGTPDDLKFADWYYGPQVRSLVSLKSQLSKSNQFFDRATFIGAYQHLQEDRYDRRRGNPWREATLNDVDVYTFTADFDKVLDHKGKHSISYGIDVTHNEVGSNAFRTNIADGQTIDDVNTRYPSQGSRMSLVGAYSNYKWKSLDSNLIFHAGLRYSFTSLQAQFGVNDPIQWPQSYLDGIDTNNGALTWGTGLNYRTTNKWHFRFLTATAFRSPNIDDFAKIREKGNTVTVPNPGLEPEHSWTTELTIAKGLGKALDGIDKDLVQLSGTVFYTQLRDAIVREAVTLPDGRPYFVSGGDSLYVLGNVNSAEAFIYGLSGNIQVNFSAKWQLRSSINWIRGLRRYENIDEATATKIDTLVPQDHIPPIYGQTSLSYRSNQFRIEAVVRYNGAKRLDDYSVASIEQTRAGRFINREGTADNIEQGIIADPSGPLDQGYRGVYAWTTFNLYTSYHFNQHIALNLGVENITDVHYRTFSSGVSAPGRNVILALRASF